jgi:putative ABC transport system substrate-binding protein
LLAHPGSNTTGISIFAHELDGKRQELLMELLPGIRRMAALADARITSADRRQALEDAARIRGVNLSIHSVGTPEEIVPAIDAAQTSGAEALNVLATPLFSAQRQMIIDTQPLAVCLPYTSGPKWRNRAGFSRTARA